jgi:hypothetical protein
MVLVGTHQLVITTDDVMYYVRLVSSRLVSSRHSCHVPRPFCPLSIVLVKCRKAVRAINFMRAISAAADLGTVGRAGAGQP